MQPPLAPGYVGVDDSPPLASLLVGPTLRISCEAPICSGFVSCIRLFDASHISPLTALLRSPIRRHEAVKHLGKGPLGSVLVAGHHAIDLRLVYPYPD